MDKLRLQRIMDVMGFPEILRGTRYLRFMVTHYTPGKAIYKECYLECAKQFNTSAANVERCARYAIKEAFPRGSGCWSAYFGTSINTRRGTPSVGEFVAKVALLIAE